MTAGKHRLPALHNAMWPGLVGKGPGSEPPIDLDTMLGLTAAAEVNGTKFDGVDLFLSLPHTDIDSTDDDLKVLAGKLADYNLVAGSLVAPVWQPTGGGSAMGSRKSAGNFLRRCARRARLARSCAASVSASMALCASIQQQAPRTGQAIQPVTPGASRRRSVRHALSPRDMVSASPRRERSAGQACMAGHTCEDLLELVDRPQTLGFQADMAHTLLYTLGYNSPESRILPEDFDWASPEILMDALRQVTDVLRPWTIDFHVAQNDATVKGSGSHDKTGRHCLPGDPNGKMDIVEVAGLWMRDASGAPTRAFEHICWDGCMFPNSTMMAAETWRSVLTAMIDGA